MDGWLGRARWPITAASAGLTTAAVAAWRPDAVGAAVGAVAVGAVTFATRVAAELQDRWVPRATDRIDVALRRRFSRFDRRYRHHVARAHRFMDLRGLGTQSPTTPRLDQVYVDVGLLPSAPHDVTADPIGHPPSDRRPIWDFLDADDTTPLAVVGAPGSGKTTLLKHVAVTLAGDPRRPLPLLLYLRDHTAEILGSADLPTLVRSTSGDLAASEPEGWLEHRLASGGAVVLLDGLDEVGDPDVRRQVVEWVDRQIVLHPRAQFVLTSRPHGYRPHPMRAATVLQARPFTPSQVDRFVRQWYRATQIERTRAADAAVLDDADQQASDLLARLQSSSALYDLAANPLLLTMIALVHCYRGSLPGTRAELYAEICHVFLGKRQEAKGLVDTLRADQKQVVLQHLAFHMMARRVRDITAAEAAEVIAPVLTTVTDQLAPADFLRAVEESSSLFLERESGVYSFAHLTFQEYLAATHATVDALVGSVADPWWHETILLHVTRADASPVVEACLAADDANALALALDCADEAQRLSVALRRRVEQRIEQGLAAPGQARVSMSALLGRKVRRVVRIGGSDHQVVAGVVTNREFGLYLQDRGRAAPPPDELLGRPLLGRSAAGAPADHPVVGVSRAQAEDFAAWLTELRDDGWTYRLPTCDEAGSPTLDLVPGVGRHSFWAKDVDGTFRLACRGDIDTVDVDAQLAEDLHRLVLTDEYGRMTRRPPGGGVLHWLPDEAFLWLVGHALPVGRHDLRLYQRQLVLAVVDGAGDELYVDLRRGSASITRSLTPRWLAPNRLDAARAARDVELVSEELLASPNLAESASAGYPDALVAAVLVRDLITAGVELVTQAETVAASDEPGVDELRLARWCLVAGRYAGRSSVGLDDYRTLKQTLNPWHDTSDPLEVGLRNLVETLAIIEARLLRRLEPSETIVLVRS